MFPFMQKIYVHPSFTKSVNKYVFVSLQHIFSGSKNSRRLLLDSSQKVFWYDYRQQLHGLTLSSTLWKLPTYPSNTSNTILIKFRTPRTIFLKY